MKKLMIALPIILLMTTTVKANELSYEDIYLIGRVVTAEANNQCELGQRYVVDTILNRVDHSDFPDTVYEVVTSPNQYAIAKSASYEILVVVVKEMMERSNNDVLYFRTNNYHNFGKPVIKIQDHYFSTK